MIKLIIFTTVTLLSTVSSAASITVNTAETSARYLNNGDSLIITTDGSITVTTGAGTPLFLQNGDNTVEVNGSIIASDVGVDSDSGDNNSIIINGSLESNNGGVVFDSDSDLTINGSLTATNYAVRMTGDDNEIIVNNRLSSSSYAVMSTGNNNSITINEGSRVLGTIGTSGTGNTLNFDVGSSMSYAFDIIGQWTVSDLDGREAIATSTIAAGVAMGIAETADELQYDRLTHLNNSLLNRVGSKLQDNAWINPYYSRSERKADASDQNIEDYKTTSHGFLAGIPFAGKGFGVLLGIEKTNLDIHSKTQEVDVTNAKVGFYIPNIAGSDDLKINAKTLLSSNSYEATRKVLVNSNTTTGITDYKGSYHSWELTTGLDAQVSNPLNDNGTSVIAGAGLDVVYEEIGSYSETANFSWKDRKLVQGIGNVKLGLEHSPSNTFTSHIIASVEARKVLSGKTTNYQINTTDVSFSGGDFNDTIRKLNVGMSYTTDTGADLNFDVVGSKSNNDTDSIGATARVSWKF